MDDPPVIDIDPVTLHLLMREPPEQSEKYGNVGLVYACDDCHCNWWGCNCKSSGGDTNYATYKLYRVKERS